MDNYTNDIHASQSTQPPPSWFCSAPLPDEMPEAPQGRVEPEASFPLDDTINLQLNYPTPCQHFNFAVFMVPDCKYKIS